MLYSRCDNLTSGGLPIELFIMLNPALLTLFFILIFSFIGMAEFWCGLRRATEDELMALFVLGFLSLGILAAFLLFMKPPEPAVAFMRIFI